MSIDYVRTCFFSLLRKLPGTLVFHSSVLSEKVDEDSSSCPSGHTCQRLERRLDCVPEKSPATWAFLSMTSSSATHTQSERQQRNTAQRLLTNGKPKIIFTPLVLYVAPSVLLRHA